MIIPTTGRQNITPKIDYFFGRLEEILPESLLSLKKSRYSNPTILFIRKGKFSIIQLLNVLQKRSAGVIFEEGTPFYHPAIYLAAEGLPCLIKPEEDISKLMDEEIFADMTDGSIRTKNDMPKLKKFDIESYYNSIDPKEHITKTKINVCLRTQKELGHIERLSKIGIKTPYIILFLEPLFYELGEDPYILSKNNPQALYSLIKDYVIRALSIASEGVYIRTPEISGHERGSDEKGIDSLTELRGIPYDIHRDNSFLKIIFTLVRDISTQDRYKYKGKLHIILAMPRSAQDLKDAKVIFDDILEGSNLKIGKDINLTAFAETPYWLIPSKALPSDINQVCKEPVKEDCIADKNGKIVWGSGDLNCCFMASSREISEMSSYLSIKSEEIYFLQESIKAWNKIGFTPDLCGSLFWALFPTEEQNLQFYKLMKDGKKEYTITAQKFLDAKRIFHKIDFNKKYMFDNSLLIHISQKPKKPYLYSNRNQKNRKHNRWNPSNYTCC